MDIVRSFQEFVDIARQIPEAKSVILDWHGVLCDDARMREMYRQAPARLFPFHIYKNADSVLVEEQAYHKWLEYFRRLSRAGIPYTRVLAEADMAYYGTLLRGLGIAFEGPRAADQWVTRKWERLVTAKQDVSDERRREGVRLLRASGLKVYIASSGSQAHLEGTVTGSGFDRLVEDVFSAEALGCYKQSPGFWIAVFERSGIPAHRSLIVDDQEKILKVPEEMGALTFLLRSQG